MKKIKVDIKHTIITHADLLAKRHEDYVGEFVTRANDELYAILAELLALHEQIETLAQRDKIIKQMRKHMRENFNIKTQSNTKTTSLVVRYVTKASRKTAHVYGRVLDIAISQGITSATLVDYIKAQGGIDRVRKVVDSAETKHEQSKREKLIQRQLIMYLEQNVTLGAVHFNEATRNNLPHASDVAFTHLLCKFNHATMQHEIVSVVYPTSTLEAQALGAHLTMLEVASQSEDHTKFYALCKELGMNMDILHRCMYSNNMATAEDAVTVVQAINATKLRRPPSSQPKLKLAA